ncbi:hypothetical protein [Chondromyces crocatus]|uniref:Uncharacterized protein n=1 Tax=Chondromyces crocatus TaxID=52 RepID=A0A0K1ES82_CHOCO|nr:hypothetical protein [Chondromyces crocatus]AKT43478.1 uncharacterized protein CMC5_077100 [Chondromyces crocatus]
MSHSLMVALEQPPEALCWACGEERATGLAVLEIARPGLRLVSATGEPEVPRQVFHDWIFGCAERLLQAYIGYGHLQAHESDWLSHGLALIKVTGAPPGEDADALRDSALTLLASLSIPARLRSGHPVEMGAVYDWSVAALSWAAKRYVRDRRCAEEPPTLCSKAADIHAEVAEHRGSDPTAARRLERAAQLQSLVGSFRQALGRPAWPGVHVSK